MPWKFVTVLVIVGLILFFVVFNMNNTSDISFGFYTAKDVPIFLSLFISFFLGFLVTLPFALSSSSRKAKATFEKQQRRGEKQEEKQEKKNRKKTKGSKSNEPPRIADGGNNSGAG